MFGYIKTKSSELKMREYEYYRASYCGLCRSMGKCTGQCSRLSLSYDFAFLANLRMALTGTKVTLRARRCAVHLIKKRPVMEQNGELAFCADASAILAFEKCRDDLADERGLRRVAAWLRCLFLRPAYRRACRHHAALAKEVRQCLASLSQLEKERRPSVDEPAALFGELLSLVAAHGLEGQAERLAREIGRLVGRFIYIVDAADDLEKDLKSGSYNPFSLLYGGPLSAEERESVKQSLMASLCDLSAAMDLIEDEDEARHAILQNILYLGMPATVDRVLCGKAPCKEEPSEQ